MIAAITGANGFIGQRLVRRFGEAGWDVRPVVRRDFESGAVDRLLAGADAVIHAAGATRAPTPAQLQASNVALTARVIEAARRGKAGRFVFISSQAAAGPASSRTNPVTEETPAAPIEAYGRSKLDAEAIVAKQRDLPAIILRPAAVYGPGDRDFLAMFRLAGRGIAIHPANRDRWFSLIHVGDLADAVIRCASTAPTVAMTGRAYFLGNDEPVQWNDVFRLAATCARRTLRVDVNLPKPLVDLGAMVGDIAARVTGRASLMTGEKVALSRAQYWLCSSARAKRELSFAPRIDLHAGFRATYEWYVANRWL